MIAGGLVIRGLYKSLRKAYQRLVNSVHVKHLVAKYCRLGDEDITFSEHDAKGIRQPHDDPFIIMLTIEGYNPRRVLVDNGSSTDIMHMMAYPKMKMDPK